MGTLSDQLAKTANVTKVVGDTGPRKPAAPATSSAVMAELEKLRAENKALAEKLASQRQAGELKVRFNSGTTKNPKTGAVQDAKLGFSVIGLNAQFPVTLYASQWVRLAEYMPTVLNCIANHVDDCAVKSEDERAVLAEKLETLLK